LGHCNAQSLWQQVVGWQSFEDTVVRVVVERNGGGQLQTSGGEECTIFLIGPTVSAVFSSPRQITLWIDITP